ncbi:MAG: cytochrome c-type biogenesis protein CcmH [SAR324 cluster bacterium]|nr:cytochrome c-type biogenesis protein CcmH [SAR324 cluster bacterium]
MIKIITTLFTIGGGIILTTSMVCAINWQATELDAEIRRISDLLRCPTCQGLSVKESESSIANSMKSEIRRLLLENNNEEQVLGYFEERYGEWILRNPKKEGFNLLAWIGPFGIFLGGGIFLIWFLRSRFRKSSEVSVAE